MPHMPLLSACMRLVDAEQLRTLLLLALFCLVGAGGESSRESLECTRLVQIPLALWVMWTPELAASRLTGKTPTSRLMLTISAGYFLYDAAVSILRYEGIAYLLHGVVSCCLYTYGALTGFLSYYGAR